MEKFTPNNNHKSQQQEKLYPKVINAIIINQKGKLLLCYKRGKYILPGGKMENKETEISALLRELKEEISDNLTLENITIKKDTRESIYNLKTINNNIIPEIIFFEVNIPENVEIETRTIDTVSKVEWVDINKVAKEKFSDATLAVLEKNQMTSKMFIEDKK